MPKRRVAARTVRPIALGASVVFHAAVILVLVRFLSQAAQHAEAPVVQVMLVPPLERAEQRQRQRSASPERRGEAGPPRALSPVVETVVAPRVVSPADADLAGRRVLQGLAGCDPARLSREARERCETRRWAALGPGPSKLNLDPSGRHVENPEPFLSRRPTKGCRVRAAGDADTMGDTGNARAGFTCVVPF